MRMCTTKGRIISTLAGVLVSQPTRLCCAVPPLALRKHRKYLECVDHWLAGLRVLAIVVVDDVKVLRRQAAGIRGAAPDHARAALGQGPVLAEGGLGAELALQGATSLSHLRPYTCPPSEPKAGTV